MTAPSTSAVADASRYFTSWLGFQQVRRRIPGVQAAVLHGDTVVASCAYGHADVEHDIALTDDHLFRIASHSKTFTATAVMQLVEAGRLRLDDTVGRWLDELAESSLAEVTVRELLAHGGGLVRDGHDGGFWQLSSPFPDTDELMRIATDEADILARNERFKYSNIGYSLLGQVIERVSGEPYAAYVRGHIVAALGLTNTGPDLDPSRIDEFVTGYSGLGYAERRVPIEHSDTRAMASATGFYSTATDVVRYVAGHFFGDARLLSDDAKRIMQKAEWPVEGTPSSYGLGFGIAELGKRRVLGHGGGFPGQITRTFFDPVDRLAVSVLTNAIDGPALELASAGFALIELAARAEASTDPRSSDVGPSRFRGRFANVWSVTDLVDIGGRLYAMSPEAADPVADCASLDLLDDTTLQIAKTSGYGARGERMTVDRADDGSIRSITSSSGMLYPYASIRSALEGRERITLADPLVPGP